MTSLLFALIVFVITALVIPFAIYFGKRVLTFALFILEAWALMDVVRFMLR